jgi:hypothetical protein
MGYEVVERTRGNHRGHRGHRDEGRREKREGRREMAPDPPPTAVGTRHCGGSPVGAPPGGLSADGTSTCLEHRAVRSSPSSPLAPLPSRLCGLCVLCGYSRPLLALLASWRFNRSYSDATPVKLGRRFSRMAAMPSRTSGPAKPRNSRARDASKLGPARRSQLLRVYLVQRMALCDPAES